MERVKSLIRDVPDFPREGILFKDITPVLGDPEAFERVVGGLHEALEGVEATKVVGIESRGFIFGAAVARSLGAGFVPVRKPGRLPYKTRQVHYELEYGTDTLEIHEDAVHAGDRVVVVDDLLATGGTAEATGRLLAQLGAEVARFAFVIELAFLKGRERLGEEKVVSLIRY
ncbi:MAG: adenine phosphoribosyltransferase [Deltaproteobacteria bacterium]|nr:MAG: adenine phosphoribosyltransferase [Deltaproteobacteria bacterium]